MPTTITVDNHLYLIWRKPLNYTMTAVTFILYSGTRSSPAKQKSLLSKPRRADSFMRLFKESSRFTGPGTPSSKECAARRCEALHLKNLCFKRAAAGGRFAGSRCKHKRTTSCMSCKNMAPFNTSVKLSRRDLSFSQLAVFVFNASIVLISPINESRVLSARAKDSVKPSSHPYTLSICLSEFRTTSSKHAMVVIGFNCTALADSAHGIMSCHSAAIEAGLYSLKIRPWWLQNFENRYCKSDPEDRYNSIGCKARRPEHRSIWKTERDVANGAITTHEEWILTEEKDLPSCWWGNSGGSWLSLLMQRPWYGIPAYGGFPKAISKSVIPKA